MRKAKHVFDVIAGAAPSSESPSGASIGGGMVQDSMVMQIRTHHLAWNLVCNAVGRARATCCIGHLIKEIHAGRIDES